MSAISAESDLNVPLQYYPGTLACVGHGLRRAGVVERWLFADNDAVHLGVVGTPACDRDSK